MSLVDFLSSLETVSSHARYVALRLVCRIGAAQDPLMEEERLLELGVKGLAKELALPDMRMSEAIGQLLTAGVVQPQDKRTGGGRPRKMLRLSDQFRRELGERSIKVERHADLITSLMELRIRKRCPEGGSDERIVKVRALKQPGKPTALNCLFASVLYAYADSFGVVDKVGARMLGRLTGLDAAGVRHQVDRLVALGFIVAHVAGGATKLLSHKRESLYVMSLDHEVFNGGKTLTRLPILPPGPYGWGWTRTGVTERIQELVQLKAQNRTSSLLECMVSWREGTEGRMQFLWASRDVEVFFGWLPWIICGYAERMLRERNWRKGWDFQAVSNVLGGEIVEEFASQQIDEEKWAKLWNYLLPEVEYDGLVPQPRWGVKRPDGVVSGSDAVAVIVSYVQEILCEVTPHLAARNDEAYSCVRLMWLGGAGLVLALPEETDR